MAKPKKRTRCRRRHQWKLLPAFTARWPWECELCGLLRRGHWNGTYRYRRPKPSEVHDGKASEVHDGKASEVHDGKASV